MVKLTEEQQYLLERAAELSGLGVSGFVRQAAVARAKEVITKEAGVDSDRVARTARR